MNKYRGRSRAGMWFMASLVAGAMAGCGSGGDDGKIFGTGVTNSAAAGGGLAAGTCASGSLPLASAADFAVLAETTLTIANPTVITGDIGATGMGVAPSTHNGTAHIGALDAVRMAAVADMQTGIGCALARACDFNYAGATDFGALGGAALAPGLHCVAGAMSVGSNLTLSTPGVYIFRAAGALTSAPTVTVALGGSANAGNTAIFWVSEGVTSAASIGATNTFLGTIMVEAGAATLGANTTLLGGRVLTAAAVTLATNTIAIP